MLRPDQGHGAQDLPQDQGQLCGHSGRQKSGLGQGHPFPEPKVIPQGYNLPNPLAIVASPTNAWNEEDHERHRPHRHLTAWEEVYIWLQCMSHAVPDQLQHGNIKHGQNLVDARGAVGRRLQDSRSGLHRMC